MASIVVAGGCRGRTRDHGATVAPSTTPSTSSAIVAGVPDVRGWFVVEGAPASAQGSSRSGAGWWFATDAVRMVWPGGRDRRTITSSQRAGDVLHLVLEEGTCDVTRTADGLLLKVAGDDVPLHLRAANDDERRALEKLDAQLIAKSGDACARATTCCAAARAKQLATDDDCTSVTTTPELSRCTRAIERLRKTALAAGQPLPECSDAP